MQRHTRGVMVAAVILCGLLAALAWVLPHGQQAIPQTRKAAPLQEATPTAPPAAPAQPVAAPASAPSTASAPVNSTGRIAISGRITNPLGAGIADAKVRATMNKLRTDARSDASGNYCLLNVHRRIPYQIVVEAPGHSPVVASFKSGDNDHFGVNFVLQPGVKVSGHAIDSANAPFVGMRLHLVHPPFPLGKSHEQLVLPVATTGEGGAFTLEAVPAGEYTFKGLSHIEGTYFESFSSGSPLILNGDRDVADVTVVFPAATGVIEGHVRDSAGKPLESVNVSTGRDTPEGLRGTQTDAQGFYRLVSLQQETYDLSFTVPGESHARTHLRDVTVGSTDADCTIEETGGISGRVLDARTNLPLSDFVVKVVRVTASDGAELDKECFGTVKPGPKSGEFSIEGVGAGTAVVYGAASGYGGVMQEVVVAERMNTDGVVLALPVPAMIEGRATLNGTPAPRGRVTVQAALAEAPEVVIASKRLGEDGLFQTDALPAGQYIVRATYKAPGEGGTLERVQQVTLSYGSTTRCDFELGESAGPSQPPAN